MGQRSDFEKYNDEEIDKTNKSRLEAKQWVETYHLDNRETLYQDIETLLSNHAISVMTSQVFKKTLVKMK